MSGMIDREGNLLSSSEISIQKEVLTAIRASTRLRDLNRGREIHAAVADSGLRVESRVASSLIAMYSRCGSLIEAKAVFDHMDSSSRDVVAWTAMILGYIDNDDAAIALDLFSEMLARGCEPDDRVFVAAIKACARLATAEAKEDDHPGEKNVMFRSLEKGMALHSHLAKKNLDVENVYVASSLVSLYGKCGAVADAWKVFQRMVVKADTGTWNALLHGYTENGEPEVTLDLLLAMDASWDRGTYIAALKACSSLAGKEESAMKVDALEKGMAIHSKTAKSGFEMDVFVANTLIDFYAACGSMVDAKRVFDKLSRHDTVSWTALILGFAENDEQRLALQLFETMQCWGGCVSDHRVFVAAAKACNGLAEKEEGREFEGKLTKFSSLEVGMAIHSRAGKTRSKNIYLASCLIEMYSRCGSMVDAHRVFDGAERNVVLWNGLMSGYAENGQADYRTYVAALKACTSLLVSEQGREIRCSIVKMVSLEKGMAVHSVAQLCNLDSTTFVSNTLIDFYAKAGCIGDAERVFRRLQGRDVVSWNSMILGYTQNGRAEAALNLFSQMKAANCEFDARTFAAVSKACAAIAAREAKSSMDGMIVKKRSLEIGFAIHREAAKRHFDRDNYVGNSLCGMYSACRSMMDAVAALQKTSRRCVISWTTLMTGYAENGEEELALDVLEWILSEKVCTPDSRTYVAALKACSGLAMKEPDDQRLAVKTKALETGMAIHSQAEKSNLAQDFYVNSSLVDLYAKCGSLADARMVFESMPDRDETLVTTMLLAYADNRQGELAIQLFLETRLRYDAWALAAVLKACSCIPAPEFGRAVHRQLLRLGLESDAVLVTSLVDFYGYSHEGNASRAIDMFREMLDDPEMQPGGRTFLSVLTSCSHAGHLEKGKCYFQRMLETYNITPGAEHYHVLIDMFGRANQLEEALAMVEAMPFEAGVIAWTTLLAACVKWKNVQVGEKAFQCLRKIDETDCASYVLMANNLLSV